MSDTTFILIILLALVFSIGLNMYLVFTMLTRRNINELHVNKIIVEDPLKPKM